MSDVELKEIHKTYHLTVEKTFPVLQGIDLKFDRDGFPSILGESGGEKSTLMNMIGGMGKDFEGEALINGASLKTMKEMDLIEIVRGKTSWLF
ncbi:MAG: ATP-binding cassette domain-containing protein [Sporolactobacillus sp.]